MKGTFCTPTSTQVIRPIKIIVVLDATLSMIKSDPNGSRATATLDLIANLPKDPEVFISVMLFAGSTTAFLTKNGTPSFDQVIALGDADKQRLAQTILTFVNPSTAPDRDSTDFIKPLDTVYTLISQDIGLAQQNSSVAPARYAVIFMSDGEPTFNEDSQLLQGDAVTRIRDLAQVADDVRFNTVHVFSPSPPAQNSCDLTIDAGCFPLIVNQDAERLAKMAQLGGGVFRDFQNNEQVNFLSFKFGQVRRIFQFKELVATNLSMPAGSPLDQVDSDGDGLSDAEEAAIGTSPFLKDSDGDGFSDGVEVHFNRLTPSGQSQPFHPLGLDPGCPAASRILDSDCDGLLDCDEQVIGTNPNGQDSDSDGVPDAVEWQMGSNPSAQDLSQDPDNDGLLNEGELRSHQNPHLADVANLSVTGYRYQLQASGVANAEGSQCFDFQIENISLANTQSDLDGGIPLSVGTVLLPDGGMTLPDGGALQPPKSLPDGGVDAGGTFAGFTPHGHGFNELLLSIALVPSDDPNGKTLIQSIHIPQTARYPLAGIKYPVDGVIQVRANDWGNGCVPFGSDGGF